MNNGQSVMAEDDTKAQGDEHGDAEAPVVDPAVPDSSALSDGAAAEHAAEHEAAPDAEEGGAEKDPSEMAMSEGLEEVPVEAADGGGEAEVAMDYDEEIHGAAAIKIQSRVRGGQVRAREMRQQRGNPVDAAASLLVEGSGFDLESRQFSPEHEVAAIRIQSRARGMQVSGVLRTCYH